MSFFNDPKRIPEKYGLAVAGALTVYFLIMKFAGFLHVVELRMLNLVFLVAGIYFALKKFKETCLQVHIDFFSASY